MNKTLLYLLVIFCLPLRGAAESQPPKFRVGVSCPLSGVLAEYGVAIRNGIALAQRLEPTKFKNVEILFEDSKWDPKGAVQTFHSLHEVKKVDVIYNWGNPTSEAVAPLAERLAAPTIAMSSDPRIAMGRRYVIRSLNSADEFGKVLATYLASQGYKRTGVLLAENSYVQGLFEGLASKGDTEILGRFSIDEQKFASVVTRLKGKNIDALGVFLISGQVSSFYRQLAVQQLKIPTFGADFLDSRNEIASAGPAIEGAVFPTFDVSESFRAKYVEQFHDDIQIPFAANAYDVVLLLADLFGGYSNGEVPPQEIISKILGVRNFNGASGIFSVRSDDSYGPSFRLPLIMKKVVQGRPVKLD